MAGPWRARIVNGGLLVLAGIVMFDVPAAYSIVRGAPGWLALAVGLVVFPVLPVTWHLVRERARRGKLAEAATSKKPAKPSKTTGWERFAFRLIVVGVLVLGALIVLDRTRVGRAVRHNLLWMLPETVEPLVPDSKLLDRVPATAEVVIWLRDTEDAHAMVAKFSPTTGRSEVVIAATRKDVMILERGDAHLIELIQPMYQVFARAPTAKLVTLDGGVRMWSTSGWPAMPSRANHLIELLARAPETAFVVGASRPATEKRWEGVTGAVGWVSVERDELHAAGEVTSKTPLGSMALMAEAERALAKGRMESPEMFVCGMVTDGSIAFSTSGVVFRARAKIAIDQIRPLFSCLLHEKR